MNNLPIPAPEALIHSQHLQQTLADEVSATGGWLSFARFMEQLLYAPGLGYYTAGARKFGAAGDFITAPEMTALFGQALARQVAQVMAASVPMVLEVGAGSGRLATDLLLALEKTDALPERYFILDLSADLRQRQHETIATVVPHLLSRVEWLDRLPDQFSGVVVANELLDAMPAHIVAWRDEGIFERGVVLGESGGFTWNERPAGGALLAAASEIGEQCSLPPGFESEISLAARAWAAEWGHRLEKGALLLIDYGFPRREFYHQQRGRGTLMCHYRHHAHAEPFYLPGLQDITAHVDFTAVVEAGHAAGLDFLGYTTQATFLFNCGLTEVLARTPADDARRYLPLANAAHKLISPAEMGELFKVIALGRGIDDALLGFQRGDRSATL